VVWASDKRGDLRGQLEQAGIPVLAFEVQDTAGAYRVVKVMGQALGRQAAGDSLLDALRASLKETHSIAAKRSRRRVFYVVYNDPPMTAGPAPSSTSCSMSPGPTTSSATRPRSGPRCRWRKW